MKLTLQMKVLPAAEQRPILLDTIERFNEAATFAAKVGFDAGVFSQPSIHARCYREIRQRFGLSAQMAVRAIGKAVEAFATLKAKGRQECPEFRPRRRHLRRTHPELQGTRPREPVDARWPHAPPAGLRRIPGPTVRPD